MVYHQYRTEHNIFCYADCLKHVQCNMGGIWVPIACGAKQYIEGQGCSATDQKVSLSTAHFVLSPHIFI